MRPHLVTVGEGAHSLETHVSCELHQLFEVVVRLSGIAHHQRGTQVNAGHFFPNPGDEFVGLFFRNMPSHALQHRVTDVLEGDVEVFADVLALAHHTQQFVWKMRWIAVMQPQPLHARHVRQSLD